MAVRVFNEVTEISGLVSVLPITPVADSLDQIFVAPTATVDGVSFKSTGREVVSVRNTHASSAWTFTIKSVADSLGRTGDIGPYTLNAGDTAMFQMPANGFKDSNGNITIVMSDLTVKVAVARTTSQLA